MPLISDSYQRAERAKEKRMKILRFLRDELYTTPGVLSSLLECGPRAVRQTLAAMERDKLISRAGIKFMTQLPPVTVVGITPHGQAMALDLAAGETIRPHYNPAHANLRLLQHTIDLQLLRIQSASKWTHWINADLLQRAVAGSKKPDAICLSSAGKRIAVECERHVKSRQRYEIFLSAHVGAIRKKKWDKVVIACPSQDLANRVHAVLNSIKTLNVEKQRILFDDANRAFFITCDYSDFICHL